MTIKDSGYTEIVRAAVYTRISRGDDGHTLTNQTQDAINYVRSARWTLTDTYCEVVSGATIEGRSEMSRLMADASRRAFDVVVFTSLSRMTRGGIEAALYILRQLEMAGVGWHFVDQPVLNYDASTPKLAKDIVLAVLAAIDEDYRRTISAKTKAALALRAAGGQKLGRPKGARDKRPRKKRSPRSVMVRMRRPLTTR